MRHPVPTNATEARFLGISPSATTWLERVAGRGTPKITDTIKVLVAAESLALDDFGHATVKALLAKAGRVTPAAGEVESLGDGTSPYAKLRPVS